MQNLGSLGGNSWAYDINNVGQVVGMSYTPNWNQRAFLWANGTIQELGALGGSVSYAYGINDTGQLVVEAVVDDEAEIVRVFLLTPQEYYWDNPNGGSWHIATRGTGIETINPLIGADHPSFLQRPPGLTLFLSMLVR